MRNQAHATGAALVPTFIYPVNGTAGLDPNRNFQWTPVADAQAYVLYIGTTAGASDLVNSGSLTQPSYHLTATLPADRTLYARLWTKVAGVWRATDESGKYVDAAFSATAPKTPTFVYPANGTTSLEPGRPFQWTPVVNAQAYVLYIGTAIGTNDLLNSGSLTQPSYQVTTALPSDRVLYARIWTKVGGVWRATDWNGRWVDAAFTTVAQPTITTILYPTNAAIFDKARPFQWSSVAFAEAYVLYVGTSVGAADLVNSGPITQTSYSVPSAALPSDRVLYARVWTKVAGAWRVTDASGRAADVTFTTRRTPLTTTFLSPATGSTVPSGTISFAWADIQAQAYVLYVGTVSGGADLFNTGTLTQTSYNLQSTILPTNRVLYARIWTKVDGLWRAADASGKYVDITFKVAPAPTAATLIHPVDGDAAADLSKPLTWAPIAGADAYRVEIGTTFGIHDLADSGEITATSYDASRLIGRLGPSSVAWDFAVTDYSTVQGYAMVLDTQRTDFGFLPPTDCGPSVPPCYRITLPPLTLGAHSLTISAYNSLGESVAPPIVTTPPERAMFARLWTRVGGVWRSSDSRFTPGDLSAQFIYPLPSAVQVDVTKPLRWSVVAGAEAYSLTVGSTPGGSDVLNLTNLHVNSYLADTLPGYDTLYARLGAKHGGVWRYTDANFVAAPAAAHLTFPVNGGGSVWSGMRFWWDGVPGREAYRLQIGSTAGGADISDSGEQLDTSFVVGALPQGVRLFARLWTKFRGVWRYVDSVFVTVAALEASPYGLSSLTFPVGGEVVGPNPVTFTWTPVAEALGYHLHVGTSPGEDNIGSSPDYQTATSFTLGGLPPGALLYARLYTQYGVGDWDHFVDVAFTTPTTASAQVHVP